METWVLAAGELAAAGGRLIQYRGKPYVRMISQWVD
jgi:hypothetical protein